MGNMGIKYQSKEESKAAQEKAFLALTPVERFYAFLDLMDRMQNVPTKARPQDKGNFLIEINVEDL